MGGRAPKGEAREEKAEGEEGARMAEEAEERTTASPGPLALPGEEPQTGSSREPTAAAEPDSGRAETADDLDGAYVPQAATLRRPPAERRTTRLPQPERPQGGEPAAAAAEAGAAV